MLRTLLIASFISAAVGVSVYQYRSSCSAHAGDTTTTSTAVAEEGGCGAHAEAPAAVAVAEEGGCGAHAAMKADEGGCHGHAARKADEGGCGAHAEVAPAVAEEQGGCGAHAAMMAAEAPAASVAPPPPPPFRAAEGTLAFDGPPPIGAKAVCPVMNRSMFVDKDTTTSVHQGKTYAFCCDGCKQAFDADPAQHLAAFAR